MLLDIDDTIIIQFSTTVNSWSWLPPFFLNWASWVIRHMSHSPFSHVDLELEDGTLLGASDSPDAPVLAGNPRGVAIRPNDYEQYGRRCRMIIRTNKANAIRAAARTQLGKPFDNSALRGFLSDAMPPGERNWKDPTAWFCSELVVWAFIEGGYWQDLRVWPKNRISPSDIFMLMLFDPNWINKNTFWGLRTLPLRAKVSYG
jgi:hypothetical protein